MLHYDSLMLYTLYVVSLFDIEEHLSTSKIIRLTWCLKCISMGLRRFTNQNNFVNVKVKDSTAGLNLIKIVVIDSVHVSSEVL